MQQNSWKWSIKAKLKNLRPQLTSDATVAAMKQKYGRCGTSGRKRKPPGDHVDMSASFVNVKTARFKVCYSLDVF